MGPCIPSSRTFLILLINLTFTNLLEIIGMRGDRERGEREVGKGSILMVSFKMVQAFRKWIELAFSKRRDSLVFWSLVL